MSAPPPKADIRGTQRHVRFGPKNGLAAEVNSSGTTGSSREYKSRSVRSGTIEPMSSTALTPYSESLRRRC